MFLSFCVLDDLFLFFKTIGFLGILGPPSYGIGATIRIDQEMLFLPYAGFFPDVAEILLFWCFWSICVSWNCERSWEGDIELVYWDNHLCTISRARSSSNWAISVCNVQRLKGSGSSSYQTILPRAAWEGVSTVQASKAPSEVWARYDHDHGFNSYYFWWGP